MSRPMLPSQNSRYWGHDLNNYLLSLSDDIDELKRIVNVDDFRTDTYILENIGFIGSSYSISSTDPWSDSDSTDLEDRYSYNSEGALAMPGLKLSGKAVYQSLDGDEIVATPFDIESYDIFATDKVRLFKYANEIFQQDLTLSLEKSFWNVYYHITEANGTLNPETVLCKDIIPDSMFILIGTLDTFSDYYVFVPRAYSAGKTFHTSVKDCYEARASIEGEAQQGELLPLVSEESNIIYYYLFANGINPKLAVTGESDKTGIHFDCKKLSTESIGWYVYSKSGDDLVLKTDKYTTKTTIPTQRQFDVYVSVSGKIFAYEHNLNNLYTDYNVSSTFDLRFADNLKAGCLVYVGTYYSLNSDAGISTFSCAQSGGVPPILNATSYNWNKLVLENKEIHSINDTQRELAVKKITFTMSGYEYSISPIPNSITEITIQSSFGGSSSNDLDRQFFKCWFNDSDCTSAVSSGESIVLTSKYYFKTTIEFLKQVIKNGASKVTVGTNSFGTLDFDIMGEPNKYKFAINPARAVSLDGTNPGFGTINLNIPDSDDLMIPVFDSSKVSTTNDTLNIPYIKHLESIEIDSPNLIINTDNLTLNERSKIDLPTLFWNTCYASSGLTEGKYIKFVDNSSVNFPSYTDVTFTIPADKQLYQEFKKIQDGESVVLLQYYTNPLLYIKRVGDSLVFEGQTPLVLNRYSNDLNINNPTSGDLDFRIQTSYVQKSTSDGDNIINVTSSDNLCVSIKGNITVDSQAYDLTLKGDKILLEGNGNLLTMTSTKTTLNRQLESSASIYTSSRLGVKYSKNKFSGFDSLGGLFIGTSLDEKGRLPSSEDIPNASLGYFDADGTIKCVSTLYTSDKRYKTNIKPVSSLLCKQAVQDLNVYSYTYTDIEKDSLGMMAQDIENYLPEYAHLLVREDSTGKKHVEEHKLLFILWQAVKELLAKQKD